MTDIAKKLDMFETGTRYKFYTELRDTFATALNILENMKAVHKGATDMMNQKILELVVGAVDGRISYLTDYDAHMARWNYRDKNHIPSMIEGCGINRPRLLTTGEPNATPDKTTSPKSDPEEPTDFAGGV
jgi:hypothetical protein